MTDVPPTPPPSGSAPAPTPTPSTTTSAATPGSLAGPSSPARATALPPELARAPAGSSVEGEVRAASGDGRVTVRTDRGEVQLELSRAQLAQLLRPGTPVIIEIRNTTVQPPVVLITAKGPTATGTAAPPPRSARQPPTPAVSAGSATPGPTVPLSVGRIVQATVVPGPSPTAAATPTAAGPGQAMPLAPPTPAGPGLPSAAAAVATTAASPAASPSPAAAAPTAPAGPVVAAPQPGSSPSMASPQLAGATAGVSSIPAPSVALPSPAPSASASNAAPAQPATAAAAETAGGGAGRTMLPHGAVLTVRIAAIAEAAARPDGAPRAITGLQRPDGSPGSAAPSRIAGQIAGLTSAGRPVVQSPVGFLALDARADLRLGTPIALDILASRSGSAPDRSAPLPVLAREWPALESALRALEEQVGAAGARQLVEAMPRPGPQLTASLLFFMSALRGGDVRAWLGRAAVQALELAGRGSLLDALSEDFQTLQRAAEPSENGWRSFLIPVAWDERRPIRLLTRHERRDDRDGRSGKPGTAFLVDLDLTSIGPFRLDGLVRSELLDLMIRTVTPLPAVMRQDIKALFDGTLERTGIVGRLTFRASPVMPPLPVDLDAATAGDTTTVTV